MYLLPLSYSWGLAGRRRYMHCLPFLSAIAMPEIQIKTNTLYLLNLVTIDLTVGRTGMSFDL